MAMKLKIILAALCVAVGYAAYMAYRTYDTATNAYAVWWVAEMVIEHMEASDGQWPSGWDDLADDYETCAKRSGRSWTFESLRGRVEVDWRADPNMLSRAKDNGQEKPFRVIWLRNGSDAHWAGREPNRMILEYLKEPKQPPAWPASVPATRKASEPVI